MKRIARARVVGKDHRRPHRSRPTPRWLKAASPEQAEARSRCLLVLSVLSGELPVSDAIEKAGISRQGYYNLETRGLQGMLLALDPMAGNGAQAASVSERMMALEAQIKRLEQEKRRAQRLLMLSHRRLHLPVRRRSGPRSKAPVTARATMLPGASSP
jgi:hypothetical protein